MSKTWDRPWTPEEIVANAPNWTLAGDAALLKHLETFAEDLFAKAEETNDNLNKLMDNLDKTSIRLDLARNEFLSLQNTQFIESRVYDDDETIESVDEVTLETKATEEERKNAIQSAILDGLEILDRYYDKVSVPASDTEDEDGDTGNYILRMKDPYAHRPLPYVIGTDEWHKKWHVGLEESSSDSETEDAGDQYSESDSENNLPVTDRRGVSTSDSGTDISNKHDRPIASSTINDTGVSTDSEDYNSMPAKAPISSTSFAEQLAAKLGTVVQGTHVPEAPEEPINKRPIQTVPTHTRIMGDILSDEPPPLEDFDDGLFSAKSSHGMFSGGDGLFDDSDDNNDYYGAPKAPAKTKTPSSEGIKVPNLFDDNEDEGIFSHVKKTEIKPEKPKIVNRGLFDDETSDEDIFAPSKPSLPSILKPFGMAPPLVPDQPPEISTGYKNPAKQPETKGHEEPDNRLLINTVQKPKKIGLFDDPTDLFKDDLFSDAELFGSPAAKKPSKKQGLFDDDDDDLFVGNVDKKDLFGRDDQNFFVSEDIKSKQDKSKLGNVGKLFTNDGIKSKDDQLKDETDDRGVLFANDDKKSSKKQMFYDDDDGMFSDHDKPMGIDTKKQKTNDDIFKTKGDDGTISEKHGSFDDDLFGSHNEQQNTISVGSREIDNKLEAQGMTKHTTYDDGLFGSGKEQLKNDVKKQSSLFGDESKGAVKKQMIYDDGLFGNHDKQPKIQETADDDGMFGQAEQSKNYQQTIQKPEEPKIEKLQTESEKIVPEPADSKNFPDTSTPTLKIPETNITDEKPIESLKTQLNNSENVSRNLFDENFSDSEDDLFASKPPTKSLFERKFGAEVPRTETEPPPAFSLFADVPPPDVGPPDNLFDEDDMFEDTPETRGLFDVEPPGLAKKPSLFDDDDTFEAQQDTSARRVMSLFDDEPPSIDFSKSPSKSPTKFSDNVENSEPKVDQLKKTIGNLLPIKPSALPRKKITRPESAEIETDIVENKQEIGHGMKVDVKKPELAEEKTIRNEGKAESEESKNNQDIGELPEVDHRSTKVDEKPQINHNKPKIGKAKPNISGKPKIDEKPEVKEKASIHEKLKTVILDQDLGSKKRDADPSGRKLESGLGNEVVEDEKLKRSVGDKTKRGSPGKLKHNLKINVGALMPGAPLPWKKDPSAFSKSHSLEEKHEEEDPARQEGPVHSHSCKDVREDPPVSRDNNNGDVETLNSITKTRPRIASKRKPSTRRARQESMRRTRKDETNNNSQPSEHTDQPTSKGVSNPNNNEYQNDPLKNLEPRNLEPERKLDITHEVTGEENAKSLFEDPTRVGIKEKMRNLFEESDNETGDIFADGFVGKPAVGSKLEGGGKQQTGLFDDVEDVHEATGDFEGSNEVTISGVPSDDSRAKKSSFFEDVEDTKTYKQHSFEDEHITTPVPGILEVDRTVEPAVKPVDLFTGPPAKPPLNLFDDDPGDFFPRNKPGKLFGDNADSDNDMFAGGSKKPSRDKKPSLQKSKPKLFDYDEESDLFGASHSRRDKQATGDDDGNKSLFGEDGRGTKKVVGKKGSLFEDVSDDDDIFSTSGGSKGAGKGSKVPNKRSSRGRNLIRKSEERQVMHDPLDALSGNSPE